MHLIKNGVLSLHGIADELSINERGERIEKKRIIHDQSFKFSKGNSVNRRLIRKERADLRYGRHLS